LRHSGRGSWAGDRKVQAVKVPSDPLSPKGAGWYLSATQGQRNRRRTGYSTSNTPNCRRRQNDQPAKRGPRSTPTGLSRNTMQTDSSPWRGGAAGGGEVPEETRAKPFSSNRKNGRGFSRHALHVSFKKKEGLRVRIQKAVFFGIICGRGNPRKSWDLRKLTKGGIT